MNLKFDSDIWYKVYLKILYIKIFFIEFIKMYFFIKYLIFFVFNLNILNNFY